MNKAWEDLSLEAQAEHTYWGCRSKPRSWWSKFCFSKSECGIHSSLFHSKEEAEAYASGGDFQCGYKWDRKPAEPCTLQATMDEARRRGRAGVSILGFKGNRLTVLKRFSSGSPLPGVPNPNGS